ncbi:methyltransferase [Candidatus Woesearchaeota archaeon]|nr:methyltransferase [Candidatus Woesearchaeota archaeon]
MIYEPSEDSFLLLEFVKKTVKEGMEVLDMGTGSGIQAEGAIENKGEVLAADINEEAVNYCKKKGINTIKSDLFENIKGKFDLIIFNPPYLPEERDYFGIKMSKEDFNYVNDIALVGGKHGWETMERFFSKAKNYLKKDGKLLVSFSSLSGDVLKIIEKYGFKHRKLAEKRIFFESLYVYECFR